MPWEKKDVERFNKGLSDKQQAVWVKVANGVLAECKGEKGDCEASAIKQANSAVKRLDASSYLMFAMEKIDGFKHFGLKTIDGEKGIEALVAGNDVIEYFFNKGEPYNWNQKNLEEWAGKKFGLIQFSAGSGVEYLPDEKLPVEVTMAREKLKSSNGGEPFIRRLALKAGRFIINGGKKVYFSQEFYDKWGSFFAKKPIYKGHHGVGTTDDRTRIGIILAYQNVEGEPFAWIYLNDRSTINIIREYEVLGINSEEDSPYGQFSLECYATKVKTHEDGFIEPLELYRKGMALALVGEAGATGTMIEKIAAMQQTEEIEMDKTKEEGVLLKDASIEDIKTHPVFAEGFSAYAKDLVEMPLDKDNPLSDVISEMAVKKTEAFNEFIGKACEGAIKMMSVPELRAQILGGATKEEVPWIAAYGEAVKELSVDEIKGLPNYPEAIKSMGKDELMELPVVKEAIASKGEEDQSMRLAAQAVGAVFKELGIGPGQGQSMVLGSSDGMTELEKKKAEASKMLEGLGSFESIQAMSDTEFEGAKPVIEEMLKKGFVGDGPTK